MMERKVIETAALVMKIAYVEAEKHYKEIPEIDAYYFWNPVRGGISVIINKNGEKLGATSSVSFEKHVKAFQEGKRN